MQRILKKLIPVLLWLLLWQAVSLIADNIIIIAGPVDTAIRLYELMGESSFYKSVFFSLARILSGLFLSLITAFVLSVVAYKCNPVKYFLRPALSFLKSVPVAAVTVMLLIWWGSDMLSFFVAFMVVFPACYESILTGLEHTDKKLLEMGNAYGIGSLKKAQYIYMPLVMPYVKSSMKSAVGMCIKACIAAEIIGLPVNSIGAGIYDSKIVLDTAGVFAYTAVVILLGAIFEFLTIKIIDCIKPGRVHGLKRSSRQDKKDFVISVKKVFFGYDNNNFVIKDFDADYEKGETYFFTTPSGEGKTTKLHLVAGLLKPDKGEINPTDYTSSFLFQDDRLLPYMNVYDNILLTSYEDMADEIKEAISYLIPDAGDKKASELSGGMKRRASILKALFHDSDILLLDEPFAGLDQDNINKVKECIERYRGERPVIIATHTQSDT